MQYGILFGDLQTTVTTLNTLTHAMKRGNITPNEVTWAFTYNGNDGVELFASCASQALFIFDRSRIVFAADAEGRVVSFTPGPWMEAVERLHDAAVQVGYLPTRRSLTQAELEALCPDFSQIPTPGVSLPSPAACPWMDSIEAQQEDWEREELDSAGRATPSVTSTQVASIHKSPLPTAPTQTVLSGQVPTHVIPSQVVPSQVVHPHSLSKHPVSNSKTTCDETNWTS